jgi:hypothetical protein
MNKEIKINSDFFFKKNKTLKKPTGKQLKRELLQRLSQGSDLIQELDELTKTKTVDPEPEPVPEKIPEKVLYGCLKNGTKPTFRQIHSKNETVKQYSSFGKKNDTVRVLIKDKSTYDNITKDIDKLKKHSMQKIRNFLRTKKLYKIGSTAPDDVLREIYVNVSLTGEVENINSDTLIHNYLNETT